MFPTQAAREGPQEGGLWFQRVWAAARPEWVAGVPTQLWAVSLPQVPPARPSEAQAHLPSCQAWGPRILSASGGHPEVKGRVSASLSSL